MAHKVEPIRSKKAMAAAKGRQCANCDSLDGVVRAHYTGMRQHQYGKGKGIKGHDCIAADLCEVCHPLFDQMKNETFTGSDTATLKKIDRSEQFLHLCVLTIVRDIQDGVLRYE